jgi:hypothetical protein
VLRALRDELTASAVHGAHNAEAFRPFNHTVNHLLDGHTPPAPPDGPVEDRGVPLPQREAGPPDTVERLFAAFRGALQAAATADEPLLIALDGLSHVEVTDRARLGVELLEPVAVGRIPGVRMVVVASEADVPEALRGRDNALRLGAFEHDDFCALVRLSLRQVGYRNDPDLGDAIARWVKKVKAPTGKMLAAFHVLGDASGLEREDE